MTAPLDEPLAARVFAFTARQTGRQPDQITLESWLLEDLGLDGDDAAEFFEAFAQEFAVDLSGLRFSYHFGPEGIPLAGGLVVLLAIGGVAALAAAFSPWRNAALIAGLLAMLGYKYWRRRSAPGPVRVFHLVLAAAAGRWIFPYNSE